MMEATLAPRGPRAHRPPSAARSAQGDTMPPADEGRLDRRVRALPPKRADAPDELPTPGSCNVPPLEVWPVPESGTNGLEPGPWMPGEWRPAREGKYLRYWPGSDDLAFSFWRGGLWHAGSFFDSKSDDQDLAWRGGVKKRPNDQVKAGPTARSAVGHRP